MKKHTLNALIIVSSAILIAAETSNISRSIYRGGQDLPDPINKWMISWIEKTDNHTHQLILKNLSTKKTKLLYSFERGLQVDWAPDGRSIAITDQAGSSDTLLYIAFPSQKELINIEKLFIKQFGRIPDIYINGHRYFEASKWLNEKQLEFTIRAYDSRPDNDEYFATYIYTLGKDIKKR
jgi:hypothetical protein